MPSTTLESKLRAHVDNFVAELTGIIKEATLETLTNALGADAPVRRGPGRPRKTAAKAAKKTTRKAKRRGGRRSSTDVEALGAAIVEFVRTNPGCSVSEIGKALSLSTKDLQLPVRKLVEAGKLRTTGQRRGTRYHAGSGRRKTAKKTTAKRKSAKKATRKVARKARKKTARRKKTSKRAA